MTELENTRNRSANNVISGENAIESFQEASALNRTLDDDDATLKLFLHLDGSNPKLAKEVYGIAEPVLIECEHYDVCNRYLDANSAIDHAIHLLILSRDNPYPALTSDSARIFAESNFRRKAGTVVGLLVIANRKDEAKEAADRAYAAWDDLSLRDSVEQAMDGVLPKRDGA